MSKVGTLLVEPASMQLIDAETPFSGRRQGTVRPGLRVVGRCGADLSQRVCSRKAGQKKTGHCTRSIARWGRGRAEFSPALLATSLTPD